MTLYHFTFSHTSDHNYTNNNINNNDNMWHTKLQAVLFQWTPATIQKILLRLNESLCAASLFKKCKHNCSLHPRTNNKSNIKGHLHHLLNNISRDNVVHTPFKANWKTISYTYCIHYVAKNQPRPPSHTPLPLPLVDCAHTQLPQRKFTQHQRFFFGTLKDEHSKSHATRVAREKFGIGLRDEEVDTVELPSAMTKRKLYSQFCFGRGWSIRANAKGKLPKILDYPRRPFDNLEWPRGSMSRPVPSIFYFLAFWK